jgi:hypothetical protein
MSIGRFMVMGLVLGAFAYNDYGQIDGSLGPSPDSLSGTDDNGDGYVNKYAYNITSCTYCAVALVMLGLTPTVEYLHTLSHMLKAEVMAGCVREFSCWATMLLFNVCVYMVAVSLMAGIVYSMLGLQGSSAQYFGLMILGVLAAYSLAVCCAFWFERSDSATRAYSIICAVMLGVSGM